MPIFLDTCLGLVNTTVREVVDLLEVDLQPEFICEALGACDPAKLLPKVHGPAECKLCEESVKTLEELLEIGHMEDEIIAEMIKVSLDILIVCGGFLKLNFKLYLYIINIIKTTRHVVSGMRGCLCQLPNCPRYLCHPG